MKQTTFMKQLTALSAGTVLALVMSVCTGCSQVTGGLSDQNPVLIAKIEIVNDPGNTIQIDDTNKAYLIYYNESDWSTPWLTHGAGGTTIINPLVSTFSTYIAAFWDANGNGVVDPGEPCTGYKNATHSLAAITPLTKITFLPLEWRTITINLDPAVTYQNSFTVEVEQPSAQADPANTLPIAFTVVFGRAIDPTTFTTADITDTGTAGVTNWTITDPIGDHMNFVVSTNEVIATGETVIPTIAAGVVTDTDLNPNAASTSTDNSVTYTGP